MAQTAEKKKTSKARQKLPNLETNNQAKSKEATIATNDETDTPTKQTPNKKTTKML